MESFDKIIIKNARFLASVGVLDHEKIRKQELFLDIELFTGTRSAGLSDSVDDTADYSEIHSRIETLIEGRHFQLIESVAEECAAMILESGYAAKVLVRVKKPEALRERNVEYAAVEIVRAG